MMKIAQFLFGWLMLAHDKYKQIKRQIKWRKERSNAERN